GIARNGDPQISPIPQIFVRRAMAPQRQRDPERSDRGGARRAPPCPGRPSAGLPRSSTFLSVASAKSADRFPARFATATITHMTWRASLALAIAVLVSAAAPVRAQETRISPAAARRAFIKALTPALPYPRARADGIPESGD